MSSEILAFLSDTSEFSRILPVPAPPFGYGVDLDCLDDITPRADDLDPNSYRGIWQHVVHMLSTPRGKLDEAPDDGLDLLAELNVGVEARQLAAMEGRVRSELLKDDRIERLSVAISIREESSRISLSITPANPALQTFALVLAVSDGDFLLESINDFAR